MVFANNTKASKDANSLVSELNKSIEDPIESKLPSSLAQGLDANRAWLQKTWEDIFLRYGKEFDSGDEVDIMTGEIIVDRGHLRRTKPRGFGRGFNLLKAEKNPMFFSKGLSDSSSKVSSELPQLSKNTTLENPLLSSPKLSRSFASEASQDISVATEILSHWGSSADSSVLVEKVDVQAKNLSHNSDNSVYSVWESSENAIQFDKIEPAIINSFSKLEVSHSSHFLQKQYISKESISSLCKPEIILPESPLLSNIITFSNVINNQNEDLCIDENAISSVSSFSLDLDPETITTTLNLQNNQENSCPSDNTNNELLNTNFKILNESEDPWNLDYVFENFDTNVAKNYDNSYEINSEELDSDDSNHFNMSFNNLNLGHETKLSASPPKPNSTKLIVPVSNKNTFDNQIKHLIINFEDSQLMSHEPNFSSNSSPKGIQHVEHLESSDSPSSYDTVIHSNSSFLSDNKPIENLVNLKRKLQSPKNSISKSRVYSSTDIITVKMNSTSTNENLDLFEFLCPEDYAYFHKP